MDTVYGQEVLSRNKTKAVGTRFPLAPFSSLHCSTRRKPSRRGNRFGGEARRRLDPSERVRAREREREYTGTADTSHEFRSVRSQTSCEGENTTWCSVTGKQSTAEWRDDARLKVTDPERLPKLPL